MSVSPFDHEVLSKFLGDEEIGFLFATEAEMAAMLRFEMALAKVQADHEIIPYEAASHIAKACEGFVPEIGTLGDNTARDGVIVPGLIKALREAVGEAYGPYVHVGATSQDVIDTSLILRLCDAIGILEARMAQLDATLSDIEQADGQTEIMGRTRMQRALPITYGDRIGGWSSALSRHRMRLDEIKPRLLQVQYGGPVGTLEKLGDKGPAVLESLAIELGLAAPDHVWHSARDNLVEFSNWLALVSGTTGKVGQDIALMAQNEIAEIETQAGGGSSAMPHKNNPIAAEALVTLARFNATQISAMHQAMIHEGERSGAAWTLEWMVLPQMVVTTAKSLSTCQDCILSSRVRKT